jgi:hypothetical protein
MTRITNRCRIIFRMRNRLGSVIHGYGLLRTLLGPLNGLGRRFTPQSCSIQEMGNTQVRPRTDKIWIQLDSSLPYCRAAALPSPDQRLEGSQPRLKFLSHPLRWDSLVWGK